MVNSFSSPRMRTYQRRSRRSSRSPRSIAAMAGLLGRERREPPVDRGPRARRVRPSIVGVGHLRTPPRARRTVRSAYSRRRRAAAKPQVYRFARSAEAAPTSSARGRRRDRRGLPAVVRRTAPGRDGHQEAGVGRGRRGVSSPPTPLATTGMPHAAASSATSPKLSLRLGTITTSAGPVVGRQDVVRLGRHEAHLVVQAELVDECVQPADLAVALGAAGAADDHEHGVAGRARACRARTATSGPLSGWMRPTNSSTGRSVGGRAPGARPRDRPGRRRRARRRGRRSRCGRAGRRRGGGTAPPPRCSSRRWRRRSR